MAEKDINQQLDLFSQSAGPAIKDSNNRKPFFAFVHTYEKAIVFFIILVITGLICFSLGVERGKRITSAKIIQPPIQEQKTAAVAATATTAQPKHFEPLPIVNATQERATKALPAAKAVEGGNYTIQLGTYKSRASAQKEAEILKKKGFSALLISKGSYTILCVGRFPGKQEAQSMLLQLSKKYPGCYLRRL